MDFQSQVLMKGHSIKMVEKGSAQFGSLALSI